MAIYRGNEREVELIYDDELEGKRNQQISKKKQAQFERFLEHRDSYKAKKVQRRNNDKYR